MKTITPNAVFPKRIRLTNMLIIVPWHVSFRSRNWIIKGLLWYSWVYLCYQGNKAHFEPNFCHIVSPNTNCDHTVIHTIHPIHTTVWVPKVAYCGAMINQVNSRPGVADATTRHSLNKPIGITSPCFIGVKYPALDMPNPTHPYNVARLKNVNKTIENSISRGEYYQE